MKQINTYINEKLRLTNKRTYTCQPKNFIELRKIIVQRIKDDGPECDLNDIDVSKITGMAYLFEVDNIEIFNNFNGDISMWDVSNVKDMKYMFCRCEKFNCDLSKWNVSNVSNMHGMFAGCENFDCDISKWDVSNVKHMSWMFNGCKKFNQDLNSWNVSKVEDTMFNTFYNCPTKPDWYDKNKCETI